MLRRNIVRSIPLLTGVVLLSMLVAPHVSANTPTPTTTTVPASQAPYIIINGPIANPPNGTPITMTETVDPAPGNASILNNTSGTPTAEPSDPSPLSTNEDPQCFENAAFALVVGLLDNYCFQGGGGVWVPISTQGDLLAFLINSSGYRVWLSQNANGSGWNDCFDHGEAYDTVGTRDAYATGFKIATSQSACSPPPPIVTLCGYTGPMAFVPDICMYSQTTYLNSSYVLPVIILTNGSQNQVWMHQNPNGSGWADCFTPNNSYDVSSTRDDNPGNIQVTTNPANC